MRQPHPATKFSNIKRILMMILVPFTLFSWTVSSAFEFSYRKQCDVDEKLQYYITVDSRLAACESPSDCATTYFNWWAQPYTSGSGKYEWHVSFGSNQVTNVNAFDYITFDDTRSSSPGSQNEEPSQANVYSATRSTQSWCIDFPPNPESEVDLDKNKGPDCGDGEGNPCSPGSGNKYQSFVDYRSADGQLSVVRHYNSLNPTGGQFGMGWSSLPALSVSTESIKAKARNGRVETWEQTTDATRTVLTGPADTQVALYRQASGGYRVLNMNNTMDTFDDNGVIRSSQNMSGLISHYTYDASGRLSMITDTYGRSLSYQFNEAGRVASITTPDGPMGYLYDALGNLAQISYPDDSTEIYHYEDTRFPHVLTGITKATSLKAEYLYNGLGQRTVKTRHKEDGTQRTFHYHYDQQGQLIAETKYDRLGRKRLSREYVWLSNKPVAQWKTRYRANGKVRDRIKVYIHSDHLNAPSKATNDAQQIVWEWNREAFGLGRTDNDPDADESKTNIPLRFAGQYKDGESGLFYNYFRYYNPQTGRYVTSDPIGLNGGINTYGYAGSNPVYWIDPYGLTQTVGQMIDSWGGSATNNFSRGMAATTFAVWSLFGQEQLSEIAAGQRDLTASNLGMVIFSNIAKPVKVCKIVAKGVARVPGRVQSRINLSNSGIDHIP